MKNTDTREVIMISIRLSTKNLQTDYYPFILEPEARHLFLKELASHFAARTDLLDIQQHLDEILLTLDGRQTEKLATPISNGGLFGTPPGFCTDTCLWQV